MIFLSIGFRAIFPCFRVVGTSDPLQEVLRKTGPSDDTCCQANTGEDQSHQLTSEGPVKCSAAKAPCPFAESTWKG